MKKVLVITYYWPPAGGITVLRCLKFVKYLREFGWEPVVFTAENPSYQFIDHSNSKDIPEGIQVFRAKIFEPINIFKSISGRKKQQPLQNITSNSAKKKSAIDKLGMWVRGNFFIPDARSAWIKPSIKAIDEFLKTNKIDAILTDGPPHTNTVIGMRISQKHNIPWLADFQDPWTQVDYYDKLYIGKRADKKHRKLEQEVFSSASKITIASPSWKEDLESIGAKNVDVIYYGYDEDDFSDFKAVDNDKFTIFHGGLLGEDRNPDGFLQALKDIFHSKPELKSQLEIRLAGEVDHSVKETIDSYGLTENTTYLGMIPRKNVLDEYSKAGLLLLPINKAANAKGRIPGKLFEMIRSGKKILVLGPSDGDVKKIVESIDQGKSFEYNENSGIQSFILDAIESNSETPSDSNYSQFSNKELTKKIATYLDEITK